MVLTSANAATITTVPVPLPDTMSAGVIPPVTSVRTVNVPDTTFKVTFSALPPESTSAMPIPVISAVQSVTLGVPASSAARTEAGTVLTGASLTAPTVTVIVPVAEAGSSQAGPGVPQLSGSPRSVTV